MKKFAFVTFILAASLPSFADTDLVHLAKAGFVHAKHGVVTVVKAIRCCDCGCCDCGKAMKSHKKLPKFDIETGKWMK